MHIPHAQAAKACNGKSIPERLWKGARCVDRVSKAPSACVCGRGCWDSGVWRGIISCSSTGAAQEVPGNEDESAWEQRRSLLDGRAKRGRKAKTQIRAREQGREESNEKDVTGRPNLRARVPGSQKAGFVAELEAGRDRTGQGGIWLTMGLGLVRASRLWWSCLLRAAGGAGVGWCRLRDGEGYLEARNIQRAQVLCKQSRTDCLSPRRGATGGASGGGPSVAKGQRRQVAGALGASWLALASRYRQRSECMYRGDETLRAAACSESAGTGTVWREGGRDARRGCQLLLGASGHSLSWASSISLAEARGAQNKLQAAALALPSPRHLPRPLWPLARRGCAPHPCRSPS